MNKYLDDYYRVSGELAKKYKDNTIWDNIPKLIIASELENILYWEEFVNTIIQKYTTYLYGNYKRKGE